MSAPDQFGYGIIGCGWVSSAHAWGVRALEAEGARLVAVADKDRERADELAGHFQVSHVYDDYRALLDRDDISAVSICLPDFLHRDVALAAAEAGKHVLCEKPLALNVQEADEMLGAFEDRNLQLGLVMNHRYFPDNIRMKAAVREGAFGRELIGSVLHSSGLTGDPSGASPWRGRRGMSAGGVLSTQAIHFLDLLLWFSGPVSAVAAAIGKLGDADQEHEDTAAVTLRLRSGAVATVVTTSASPIMDDFTGTRIEVHGTQGWSLLEGDSFRHFSTTTDAVLPDITLPPVPEGASEVVFGVGHIHEIIDFVHAMRRGAPAPVHGLDGRHLMAVLAAAYTSAREQREVEVSETRDPYTDVEVDVGSLLNGGAAS